MHFHHIMLLSLLATLGVAFTEPTGGSPNTDAPAAVAPKVEPRPVTPNTKATAGVNSAGATKPKAHNTPPPGDGTSGIVSTSGRNEAIVPQAGNPGSTASTRSQTPGDGNIADGRSRANLQGATAFSNNPTERPEGSAGENSVRAGNQIPGKLNQPGVDSTSGVNPLVPLAGDPGVIRPAASVNSGKPLADIRGNPSAEELSQLPGRSDQNRLPRNIPQDTDRQWVLLEYTYIPKNTAPETRKLRRRQQAAQSTTGQTTAGLQIKPFETVGVAKERTVRQQAWTAGNGRDGSYYRTENEHRIDGMTSVRIVETSGPQPAFVACQPLSSLREPFPDDFYGGGLPGGIIQFGSPPGSQPQTSQETQSVQAYSATQMIFISAQVVPQFRCGNLEVSLPGLGEKSVLPFSDKAFDRTNARPNTHTS